MEVGTLAAAGWAWLARGDTRYGGKWAWVAGSGHCTAFSVGIAGWAWSLHGKQT